MACPGDVAKKFQAALFVVICPLICAGIIPNASGSPKHRPHRWTPLSAPSAERLVTAISGRSFQNNPRLCSSVASRSINYNTPSTFRLSVRLQSPSANSLSPRAGFLSCSEHTAPSVPPRCRLDAMQMCTASHFLICITVCVSA